MWDELLKGVGAFTIAVMAFNYYERRRVYRQTVESIKAEIGHLMARKAAHPEEAAALDARIAELHNSYPAQPRVV